jgi:anthranilate phosphoribosyltransferase/anthranilate synthase/phosphoribosyltransferase
LGHEAAWIVHGMGLDELTVAGQNHVTALRDGSIASFVVEPEDAGLSRAPIEAIKGGDAGFNASALEAMLQGARGAYRDTVLLNAAAALIAAGRAGDLREGVSLADRSIASGSAFAALETLRRVSAVTVS